MKRTVALAPQVRRVGLVVTTTSLVVICFETLLPESGEAVGSHLCLLCGPFGGVNSFLNVLLFVPLGVGLALAGFSSRWSLIGMCTFSALIEVTQLVVPGRYSTIGDVISNSLGGALGFAIARYWFTLLRPSPRIATGLVVGWSAVWLVMQTISAYGFSPTFPSSGYYGQLAPSLGSFEQFQGRVLRASIADIVVPDGRFADSRRVRDHLLGDAMVTTTIVPNATTPGVAPIVRIADDKEREILLLAQSASQLVFGVRTGAAALRLRPPLFAMSDVFAPASEGDSAVSAHTLTVSARYSAREVWMNTRSAPNRDRRIPIAASLGWTMLLPLQWFITGTGIELVVSAIWIVCLALPIGFWARRIVHFRGTHAADVVRIIVVPIVLLLLYVGMVLVPGEFGLAVAPTRDWLAAVTGILAGSALAGSRE
jgi:VanZ like family